MFESGVQVAHDPVRAFFRTSFLDTVTSLGNICRADVGNRFRPEPGENVRHQPPFDSLGVRWSLIDAPGTEPFPDSFLKGLGFAFKLRLALFLFDFRPLALFFPDRAGVDAIGQQSFAFVPALAGFFERDDRVCAENQPFSLAPETVFESPRSHAVRVNLQKKPPLSKSALIVLPSSVLAFLISLSDSGTVCFGIVIPALVILKNAGFKRIPSDGYR